MSNEGGAFARKVVGFPRHPSGALQAHRRRGEGAHLIALRTTPASIRMPTGNVSAMQPTYHVDAEDPLPMNEFLKDLHREKRRAERSRVALSLVMYEVGDRDAQDGLQFDQLLEVLHSVKRETDIIGHVGNGKVAVLCPDTDEQGTKGLLRKIDAHAGSLPFTPVTATYPNVLFDSLAKGTEVRPAFQPFLGGDLSGQHSNGFVIKRALDIVGTVIALCIFGPLMVLVAAAIALTSRGPIIFKQTRLGRGGAPFTFYKFRSMVVNGDDGIHREFVANLIKGGTVNETAAARHPAAFKLQSDPRITRIGRFIRKTSIDELPQLFNVLKGDMSLVGPRPPIPYEAVQYQSWHLRRILAIKPGITGLWQVEGRSKVSFNDMVRMDLRYIRNCSLALDLRILLKTVAVVFRCDGAR